MQFSPELIEELRREVDIDDKLFSKLLKANNNDYEQFILMLIKEGYISRKKWGKKIGDAIDFAYLPLNETYIDDSLLELIPQEIAEKYSAMIVYKFGSRVSIALKNPLDHNTKVILSRFVGHPISALFSFEDEIKKSIAMHYGAAVCLDTLLEKTEKLTPTSNLDSPEQLVKLASNKEVKDLANTIIYMALKDKVSDIHIESKKHHVLLRFRKDGVLFNQAVLPLQISASLTNYFKTLAQADISEKRRPQDGRFDFALSHHTIDIRLSVLPTLHGEKLVMRLLGTEFLDKYLDFDELGFSKSITSHVQEALNAPNGMIFVTGPTGSGKTTTLHCALNYLSNPGINIVTIENPIEYEHPNITQISVEEKIGRNFSSILRAVLRQDPDVIMIGEIRDLETARIAANAALTGHMVLTSLHTNNAIQAVTRMVEMGVEHFVIAPSVIGVLGQRLVRKICSNCMEAYTPNETYMSRFFDLDNVSTMPELYRGSGCHACNNTGFSGRIAIHEFLGITDELRNHIIQSQSHQNFYQAAIQSEHYQPLAKDGFKKALMGQTTLEEVASIVRVFEDK
ncbi:GspE/PulE family protein [Spartinivicinus ruber]|uniref:GspE/PulE family protein n=1 Tax=Spartinivicinus ruber TaxID=2683272 RepID=UPI0013D7639A|nr:GspE/PulE family protein [Spartinivicinus ruber]